MMELNSKKNWRMLLDYLKISDSLGWNFKDSQDTGFIENPSDLSQHFMKIRINGITKMKWDLWEMKFKISEYRYLIRALQKCCTSGISLHFFQNSFLSSKVVKQTRP